MNAVETKSGEAAPKQLPEEFATLKSVVDSLLIELRSGSGDRDKRKHVEEWMRTLGEKYPQFGIEAGLREYYLAEAKRLRDDFEKAPDLADKLAIGRAVETYLEKASELRR